MEVIPSFCILTWEEFCNDYEEWDDDDEQDFEGRNPTADGVALVEIIPRL